MDLITSTMLVILLAPLASAALIALFGRRRPRLSQSLSLAAAGAAALGALRIARDWDGSVPTPVRNPASWEWLSLGDFSVSMGFLLNHTTSLMLFVVTFVGFWIHVFSLGYMRKDKAQGRYFGGLSIFMFSMLGIVLADNLIMLFVFWELVGFSSYMLIGHYLEKPSAAAASKKAFIVNRVGDLGFLLGIVYCYSYYGTVNLFELERAMGMVGHNKDFLAGGVAMLLFCGVLGKSAQLPLHVWLPDAMEGPTPVSALIHAATMVAAGVYLLARVWFLFPLEALQFIACVGVATALYAALCALVQNDIKKILAYSTLSQLGYMVAAFGLGTAYGALHGGEEGHASPALYGVAAAMFHLATHAYFKALLFLGAGSVIDACHHEQDIRKMGGLARKMPATFAAFSLGALALSGVPMLAGFYSKDAILAVARLQSPLAFALLSLGALLTAFYMGRLMMFVFFGSPRSHASESAKESGIAMLAPLLVLGLFAVAGGWLSYYPDTLRALVAQVPHPEGGDYALIVAISVAAALLGLGGAALIYRKSSEEDALERKTGPLFGLLRVLTSVFDNLYAIYLNHIQRRLTQLADILDQVLIGFLAPRAVSWVAMAVGAVARGLHAISAHGALSWIFIGIALLGALFYTFM